MKYLENFFPIYNDSNELSEMMEFSELSKPGITNGFRNHQIVIERLMSPYTPYKSLLLKHSMGTGKTCIAFLVINSFLKIDKNSRILILCHNTAQLINFKQEIKDNCISYLDSDDFSELDKDTIRNLIDNPERVQFKKFHDVSKIRLINFSVIIIDEAHNIYLEEIYSSSDFFKKKSLYEDIKIFLDRQVNAKKILMTGTPITDNYTKLFELINLINEPQDRLQTSKDITDSYYFESIKVISLHQNKEIYENGEETEFNSDSKPFLISTKHNKYKERYEYVLKKERRDDILRAFKNKVSVFTNNTLMKQIENGESWLFSDESFSMLKVHIDLMEGFQKNLYKLFYQFKNEFKQNKSMELQLSLFVFPYRGDDFILNWTLDKNQFDHLYSKNGEKIFVSNSLLEYVFDRSFKKYKDQELNVEDKYKNFVLILANSNDLEKWLIEQHSGNVPFKNFIMEDNKKKTVRYKKNFIIKDKSVELYEEIKNCSTLYYNLFVEMGEISNAKYLDEERKKRQREAVFFFNIDIKEGGNKMLVILAKKMGFQQVSETTDFESLKISSEDKHRGRRFAIVSSGFGVTSPGGINKIINVFREEYNRYGDSIRLLIGSEVLAFGYNIYNIRQVHIVLPWNSPIMDQAIYRALRGKSFNYEEENYVRIYRHFITYKDNNSYAHDSFFERRLKSIEEKDKKNSQILYLLDSSAIDRNINVYNIPQKDFEKECNYMKCSINFNIDKSIKKINNVSNYISLYKKKNIFLEKLQTIFREKYCISLEELLNDSFIVISDIYELLSNQSIFKDRYGFNKVLSIYRNLLYLTDTPFNVSENQVISSIIRPIIFVSEYNYDNVDDIYFLSKDEKKIDSFLNQPNDTNYRNLSIYGRVFVFEEIFSNPKLYNDSIKEVILENENGNYILSNENLPREYQKWTKFHKIYIDFYSGQFPSPQKCFKESFRVFNGMFWDYYIEDNDFVRLFYLFKKNIVEKKESSNILHFVLEKDDKNNIRIFKIKNNKRISRGNICHQGVNKLDLIQNYANPLIDLINSNHLKKIEQTDFLKTFFINNEQLLEKFKNDKKQIIKEDDYRELFRFFFKHESGKKTICERLFDLQEFITQ